MSRYTLEPFMAVRHFSSPPSSPRKVLPSRLLMTLDQELEKMNLGDKTPHPSEPYSRTLGMAMGSTGDDLMGPQNLAPGTSVPSFFRKQSNVVSTSTSYKKAIPTYNEAGTHILNNTGLTMDSDTLQTPTEYPLYTYKSASPPPTVHYIRDEVQANELVSKLIGPLGFDLEWRVIFRPKMIERKTAVLQLCDERMILILQLASMKQVPQRVKDVMENRDIVKMGVNILNDGRKLLRDYGIESAGLLEMSHLARLVDPSRVTSKRMIGLQRIVEMYTGHTLSKGSVRTSNWEVKLDQEQLEYAANDAHSALKVYNELMQLARTAKMDLKAVAIPGGSPMAITFVSESPINNLSSVGQKSRKRRTLSSNPTPMAEKKSQATGTNLLVKAPQGAPRPGEAMHITSVEQLQAFKVATPKPVGGQLLRAYKLWHEQQLPLQDICSALRSPANPLTKGTVITYVVEALKADTTLPFSRQKLKELIQQEVYSLKRHGWWVTSLDKTNRGLEGAS